MTSKSRHLVWINAAADFAGGCETYVHEVASALRKRGYRNTLLYELDQSFSSIFAEPFDAVFPLVEPAEQLRRLKGDAIYVHRLSDESRVAEIVKAPGHKLRFLHDHRLFCLREHKYTTLTHTTCTRTTGLGCYTCLGCFHRSSGPIPIGFRSLGSLEREQRMLDQFDRLVVGSDYFRNHVIEHGFEADRVERVRLFARRLTIEKAPERVPGQIVFAGTLVRAKGIDVLLNALAKVTSNFHLQIIGQGHQRSRFEELAQQLGLADRVTFKGSMSASELAPILAASQFLVFPSITPETFGLIGVEALSLGTPVIASDVGGISQWLRHGENGLLVPPNDSSALAMEIEQLLRSPERCRELGSNGQRDASEWCLANSVDDLERVLDDLMGARPAHVGTPVSLSNQLIPCGAEHMS